jgi:diguanylate cyclase (GGDEF)-like protein
VYCDPVEPVEAATAARLAPFAALSVVALVLALPLTAPAGTYVEYGLAWLMMIAVGGAALAGRSSDAVWLRLARALLYLIGVGLLREVTGGARGGVGIIVLVPVIWIALYGTPRMLRGILVGVALTWTVPLVAIGSPDYPQTGWRSGVLIVALAAIVGTTVQRLVDQTREHAASAQRHAGERERLLARVSALAHTDALTGVANRRAWEERFSPALQHDQPPICVAVLDLDRFKSLNDEFGHDTGDRCLRDSAAAWSAQLRAHDVLARVGGDEFAILLPSCSLEQALAVAERVREATVLTTCSIGVAEWDRHESPEALQRRADELLYDAKRRRPTLTGR